jgi:hypothetical protein
MDNILAGGYRVSTEFNDQSFSEWFTVVWARDYSDKMWHGDCARGSQWTSQCADSECGSLSALCAGVSVDTSVCGLRVWESQRTVRGGLSGGQSVVTSHPCPCPRSIGVQPRGDTAAGCSQCGLLQLGCSRWATRWSTRTVKQDGDTWRMLLGQTSASWQCFAGQVGAKECDLLKVSSKILAQRLFVV